MSEVTVTRRYPEMPNFRRFRSHTPRPRVLHGMPDTNDMYPYVVRLMMESRPSLYIGCCTGFLISGQWAVTAAHCLRQKLRFIMCGNMSVSFNETKCKSRILEQIPHQAFLDLKRSYFNDIALLHIEEMYMANYGRLHAADYKTFEGRSVRYAGFGFSHYTIKTMKFIDYVEHDKKPLQIGEGVIHFGDEKKMVGLGRPQFLIAPKCSNPKQHMYSGDSGGPLLVSNMITGVACYVSPKTVPNIKHHPALFGFTPLSPYLDWIRHNIVSRETVRRKTN